MNNLAKHQAVVASSVLPGKDPATLVNGISGNSAEIFSTKIEDKPSIKIDLHGSFNVQLVKVGTGQAGQAYTRRQDNDTVLLHNTVK